MMGYESKNMTGHSFCFFASGNTVSMKWIKDDAAFGQFAELVTECAGTKPAGALQASPWRTAPPSSDSNVFEALERLGKLRDAGVVTAEEFEAKKAELLSRV